VCVSAAEDGAPDVGGVRRVVVDYGLNGASSAIAMEPVKKAPRRARSSGMCLSGNIEFMVFPLCVFWVVSFD